MPHNSRIDTDAVNRAGHATRYASYTMQQPPRRRPTRSHMSEQARMLRNCCMKLSQDRVRQGASGMHIQHRYSHKMDSSSW